MTNPETISVKIVIMGEPAVGKTTLRQSFIGKEMKSSYLMTLGADIAESKIQITNNITLEAQIWDLAGQENFKPLTRQFLQGAQGAIVVFDLTRDYTFDEVNTWLEMLQEENPNLKNNIPFVIVGNKEDLQAFIKIDDGVVTNYIEYVNRHHVFSQSDTEYIRTSAKTGHRVQEAFKRLGEIIVTNFKGKSMSELMAETPAPVEEVVPVERIIDEPETVEPESQLDIPVEEISEPVSIPDQETPTQDPEPVFEDPVEETVRPDLVMKPTPVKREKATFQQIENLKDEESEETSSEEVVEEEEEEQLLRPSDIRRREQEKKEKSKRGFSMFGRRP